MAVDPRPACATDERSDAIAVDAARAHEHRRPLADSGQILAAKRGPGLERDQLVQAFMPLIARVARMYRGSRNVDQPELMQSGVVGLLQALERYDPDLETPFWGYASFWVRQSMQELLSQLTRPIVLSDRAARQLARINHARQDLASQNGGEASTEALAEETGISQGQIGSLTAASRSARGLDEPQHSVDGDAATFGERLCDPSAEDAFDEIARRIEAEAVPHLLDALNDRERTLVRARYGLGGEQQTLREVGRTLSVSVERVRQLEERAIEKLRAEADSPAHV